MVTGLAQWSKLLSLVSAPVYFLLAFVLFRRGLWRSYLYFWLYLIVEGVATIAYVSAGQDYKQQILVYRFAQPPIWILYILTVTDLFRKLFVRFPGISRLAQRLVILSILIGFVFSLASVGGDMSSGWHKISTILRYSVIERVISSALGIYLILIAAFLVWMPVPLPRNTVRHSVLFFFYFLVITAIHYVVNIQAALKIKHLAEPANLGFSLVTLAALLAWLFLLRPEGEALPAPPTQLPPASPGPLLDRLESLNQSLSRSRSRSRD